MSADELRLLLHRIIVACVALVSGGAGFAVAAATMAIWPIVIGGPLGGDTPLDHAWLVSAIQHHLWVVLIPLLIAYSLSLHLLAGRRPILGVIVAWVASGFLPALLSVVLGMLGDIVAALLLPIALRLVVAGMVGGSLFAVGAVLLSRARPQAST